LELDGRRLELLELPLGNRLSVSAGIDPITGHTPVFVRDKKGRNQNGRNDFVDYRNPQRSAGGQIQALETFGRTSQNRRG
jgi:hypothetical protein